MPHTNAQHDVQIPLRPNCTGDISKLRDVLASAGYNQDNLVELIRSSGSAKEGIDLSVAMRRTAPRSALHSLFRLFVLGQSVTPEVAQQAFSPMIPDQIVAMGLLKVCSSGFRAQAKLTPFKGHWVLGDFLPCAVGRSLPADHVLGAGAASATLAGITPRRPVESVLDLGCGSGVQSFVASQQARRIIGTDINRRALNFAAFGAALNGIENVEFRVGHMFQPAEGEQFDLIVSNPPFVISPESRYAFRDGGCGGDAISEQLIRQTADYLRQGGCAVFLFNWYHKDEDDWSERPAQWLPTDNCDVWLMRFHTEDPLTYAAQWLRPTESHDRQRYGCLLDDWMDYYRKIGAARVSAGAVVIRKRSGTPNWIRCQTLPEGRHAGDCGDQIERMMDAETLLQSLENDSDLLDLRFRLSDDHRLEQSLVVQNGQWEIKSQSLKQTTGFTFSGQIDGYVAAMLAGCDGKRPLRDLVNQMATNVGDPPEQVVPVCVAVVKKMVRSGLLYPVCNQV